MTGPFIEKKKQKNKNTTHTKSHPEFLWMKGSCRYCWCLMGCHGNGGQRSNLKWYWMAGLSPLYCSKTRFSGFSSLVKESRQFFPFVCDKHEAAGGLRVRQGLESKIQRLLHVIKPPKHQNSSAPHANCTLSHSNCMFLALKLEILIFELLISPIKGNICPC